MGITKIHACSTCGAELISKVKRKHPVALQLLFGASFLAFLVVTRDSAHSPKWLLWSWTAIQLGLGYFLVKARMRAKQRNWHCNHCQPSLP